MHKVDEILAQAHTKLRGHTWIWAAVLSFAIDFIYSVL